MESSEPRITSPRPGTPPAVGNTMFLGKGPFWYPLVPLIVLDLWSKSAVFAYLVAGNSGRYSMGATDHVFETALIDFDLVTWLNRGTIWGLGAEFHEPLKFLRLGAIALILYFVYRTLAERRVMLVALSLILAGALGNMYDNFINVFDPEWQVPKEYAGAVRDFIHFHNGKSWDFPAFNVADSCITVGAITLFILLWRTPDDTRVPHKPAT